MDFLDLKKQRTHMIRLIVGYVLIGIAILIATIILLYQAYGFGIDKDGQVIQNGFVFMSSSPNPASIYIDGKLNKLQSNTRLQLPAKEYRFVLQRAGYDNWQRNIVLEGGSVQRYDYPLLIPSTLALKTVQTYGVAPGLVLQTPDHRWMIVQKNPASLNFDQYDLSSPTKLKDSVTTLNLPETIVSGPTAANQKWQFVEWASDNRHVILLHSADGVIPEYILFDRQSPADSQNVTRNLKLSASQQLSLHDKKFDRYYLYDTVNHSLGTLNLSDAGIPATPLLDHVLAFKPYSDDTILYASDLDSPNGMITVWLRKGSETYKIRDQPTQSNYLIDITKYNGNWYAAVGAATDNKVYLYKNPQIIRKVSATASLVPIQVMRVVDASYMAFSSNNRFVIAENGSAVADYDIETDKGYNFSLQQPIDAPVSHVTWVDGYHLMYVSEGKAVMLDYDNTNQRLLSAANPAYGPLLDRDVRTLYTFPTTTMVQPQTSLSATSLRIPADQ